LERFDDFWGERLAARRIEYILYPETSSRMTALITCEVDFITQLPPDQLAVIEGEPHLEVKSLNLSNMHLIQFNLENPPYRDVKFRQALALAIDRLLLSDTFWGGKAIVPRGHQYPE
jgi:peptide/nickel transport system substrate-binding protein